MTTWREQINKHTVQRPAVLAGHGNGQLPASVLVDVYNGNGKRIGKLNPPAARSWTAMAAGAKSDGVILDATDTYRTLESQQRIWDDRYDHTDHGNGSRTCNGDKRFLKDNEATVACPGTSKHGDANAVDDRNQTAATGLTWLENNAGRYGWEWEVPSEVWHLHYWPGDDIPQAVLDFETGHNESEEDILGAFRDEVMGALSELVGTARADHPAIADMHVAVLDPKSGLGALIRDIHVDVDEEALGKALSSHLSTLDDKDVARIARAAADEHDRRERDRLGTG